MALRETLIAGGLALGIAGTGSAATYIATVSALGVRLDGHDRQFTAHDKMFEGNRTELNSMHQRENVLAEGNVTTRAALDLMSAKLDGRLALLASETQHIKETVDEIRGAQKKHPTSVSGSGSDQ